MDTWGNGMSPINGNPGRARLPIRRVKLEQAARELGVPKRTPMRTRVVLAEDHVQVRAGIRQLLERYEDIQVVGEASNGIQAVEMVDELCPDVLVLDVEMPVMGGGQVAEELRRTEKDVSILVLSAHDDVQYILSMFEQGVSGYIVKEEAPEALVAAIRDIAGGNNNWISSRISEQLSGFR